MIPRELTIACWLFDGHGITSGGRPVKRDYCAAHVNRFARQVHLHYPHPHRVVCITDQPEGIECEVLPMPEVCAAWPKAYRKLWLFSEEAAKALPGRVFYSDIDVEILRDITPLVAHHADLVVWRDRHHPPWRISSGNYLLTTGAHCNVWNEFSFEAIERARPWHEARFGRMTGSDQAWMSYALWSMYCGDPHRKLAFFEEGIHRAKLVGSALPADARIVHFSGNAKPWHESTRRKYPWLRAA